MWDSIVLCYESRTVGKPIEINATVPALRIEPLPEKMENALYDNYDAYLEKRRAQCLAPVSL